MRGENGGGSGREVRGEGRGGRARWGGVRYDGGAGGGEERRKYPTRVLGLPETQSEPLHKHLTWQ